MDLEKAAKMWDRGSSISQIAASFGMTKGQVSGRISRNRHMFPKRDVIQRLELEIADALFASIKADEKPKKRSANTVRKMFNEAFKAAEALPKPKEKAQAYDQSRLPGYTLWELDARGCKFAITDGSPYRFCGETRYQMKPWCKAHHERVWRAQ